MGAAVAIVYSAQPRSNGRVAGLVLLSPMCGIHQDRRPPEWALAPMLWLGRWLPWVPYAASRDSREDDPTVGAGYRCAHRQHSGAPGQWTDLGTMREIYLAAERVPELGRLLDCRVSVLVAYGTEDMVIDTGAVRQLMDNIPHRNKKAVCLPGDPRGLVIR